MGNYLKLSNRYLLKYSVNGNEGVIKYSDLKQYYDYATKDDCEYINANICDDKIVICFTVAQGQGGVVAVWDTSKKAFSHISNGEYAISAKLYNNNIYVLRELCNICLKSHFELSCLKYGTFNINEPENIILNNTNLKLNVLEDDFDLVVSDEFNGISIKNNIIKF